MNNIFKYKIDNLSILLINITIGDFYNQNIIIKNYDNNNIEWHLNYYKNFNYPIMLEKIDV